MSKFRTGDRVSTTHGVGTIRDIKGSFEPYLVEHDAWRGGHSGGSASDVHVADDSGWWYGEGEISIIEGDTTKVARRTFKLIKDTPIHKKGTLFQEQCDDGTQPYIVLNPAKYDDFSIKDRKLVEEQPQWFVEVLQVEPQYMTREELDKWEAFKAAQPAKSRKVLVADTQSKPEVTKKANTLSDEHLAKFVRVYNSSRTTKSTADKMKINVGSVHAYKHIALRRGHTLKTMKRAKAAQKSA
ncbi:MULTISPECIES: hypothetical protein [Arthrobacter]|uniref:Uncharacterized protein n=1 Tax=Arthrobacter terricola TaxID=2547396 RepID=A0A4R5KLZ6_9MICC|nr:MULTISPECIES: hypothetical protein [Arthrobacter]MBT8161434.1 hypothetical protein [Arthrobacter sp. GN70]TDF95607.1 hypothetical protein E1809_11310 [Arthrobacter terricola]